MSVIRSEVAVRVALHRQKMSIEEKMMENAIRVATRHLTGEAMPCYKRGERLLGGEERVFVCRLRQWDIYERVDQSGDGRRKKYVAVLAGRN